MTLFFPDNTVLVNFVLMGREDVFIKLAQGNGKWTLTIAGECHRSSFEEGLGGLIQLSEALGEPIMPTPAERLDTEVYRQRLARADDPPGKHLGEAEALAIISGRGLEAIFVTDDRGARQLADAADVMTVTTIELLRVAVRGGLLSADAAWALVELLRARGRAVWHASRTFVDFRKWVG